MVENDKRYWVALAVDNSVPRPKPNPETGFLPMYFNASPLLVPTDEGDDAVCLFSTEEKAYGYLHEASKQALITPAVPMSIPVAPLQEAFQEYFAHFPAPYVVIDPEYGALEHKTLSVEEFLKGFE